MILQGIRNNKKIVWSFIIGFLIGILLEIILLHHTLEPRHVVRNKKEVSPAHKSLVFCLVILKSKHNRNLLASQQTWLKHCDNFKFVQQDQVNVKRNVIHLDKADLDRRSSRIIDLQQNLFKKNNSCQKNDKLDVKIDKVSSKNGWDFLCKSFHMIKNHTPPSSLNWLLIVPDNVFVIVENLRYLVKNLDHNKGIYLGHPLKHYMGTYNTLSAGIVVSNGALQKLLESFNVEENCHTSAQFWNNEDIYLGKHLRYLEIIPEDTRDSQGRGRFHAYNIHHLLSPGKLVKLSNYWKNSVYPVLEGEKCCSPLSVTIDGVQSDGILHHYYFLYMLNNNQSSESFKTRDEAPGDENWKSFLKKEGLSDEQIEKVDSEEYYQIWSRRIMPPEAFYERLRKDFGQ